MKHTLFLLSLIASFTICFGQKTIQPKQEVDFVNSYIGTALKGDGGMIPMVGYPFAMTNFTPQTCENRISKMPYNYEDSTIHGFIATHQPSVWMGDYGYVSIMPQLGSLKVLPDQRKMAFSHTDEKVSPFLYSVKMHNSTNQSIKVDMAATERCGILQFTFPETKEAHIIIQSINVDDVPELDLSPSFFWIKDLNAKKNRAEKMTGYVNINKEKNEITGYNTDRMSMNLSPELNNFKGYFIIQFEKPFSMMGTWNNDSIKSSTKELLGKKRIGAYVSYSTKKDEVIKVKIATSFISIEQARENMKREIPDWDLQKVVTDARNIWQKNLERIKIDGVTDDQKTIFYTAFYHSLLYPRLLSEYGRYYSGFDDKIHEGVQYNDYSLWDTFRALHPFLILAQPERINDMITSMLQMYKEGGRLPMWPNPSETNIMIGTHSDPVIADAYVKGFRGFDVNLAYEAMLKNSMVAPDNDTICRFMDREDCADYEARAGLTYYHSLGYIPVDKTAESVSRALEYSLDDYCVAQVAKGLGKTEDYKKLMAWSDNYKNHFNKETGFMAPRLYNGKWHSKADDGFTEGGPWTYLFCVMQDIPGLIDLMGGNEKFAAKLDQNFSEKHYAHSNEPGHHYTYLYDYCGQPWKTQELIRKHTVVNYKNAVNGINGNDDCGQMSAWYLFSVMGFYPVTSGSADYAIGAPQFPHLTLNFTVEGKLHTFEITANNISEENKYIQKVTLNSKPLENPFITHQQILNGSKLVFEMGPKPNYSWK